MTLIFLSLSFFIYFLNLLSNKIEIIFLILSIFIAQSVQINVEQ